MFGDRSRRAAAGTAGAVLAAGVMLSLTSLPAHADDEPVTLPPLALELADDVACTAASDTTAESRPWTWRALQLTRARQLSSGEGVTVGVVGTGVGADVPALSGRLTAVGEAGVDCVGHGSFAAGLIAGAAAEDGAVAGVAPAAEVVAARATTERGAPDAATAAAGVRAAVEGGASVIWVGVALRGQHDGLTEAVDEALAADVVVVAPAAPDVSPEQLPAGEELPPRDYWPAAMPQVLSVLDFGPQDVRADGAPLPLAADLAAPGGDVVGIGPEGQGHFLGTGPSLAAAHVAGAAALVRSHAPELDREEVVERLLRPAYPDVVPRLDVVASLTSFLGRPVALPEPEPAVVPPPAPAEPATRALWTAGIGAAVVLVVGALIAVVPRGKARGWRPAGSAPPLPGDGPAVPGPRPRRRAERAEERAGASRHEEAAVGLAPVVAQSAGVRATPGTGAPLAPRGETDAAAPHGGGGMAQQRHRPMTPSVPPLPPAGGGSGGGRHG
ncbi:S8 family serine peptidase [Streptomyces bohaiensis]|uniref:S8 family serine peptidase n=1 Tax=Streptomyces bohaiensis TaxID=1431344 RepID=UPI003B7986A8